MDSISEKTMVKPDYFCPHCKKKLLPGCTRCGSLNVTRNGGTKKNNYRCGECGKQFVSDPVRRRITEKEWAIVDSLLSDFIEVSIIHRAIGISKRHIYNRKTEKESL